MDNEHRLVNDHEALAIKAIDGITDRDTNDDRMIRSKTWNRVGTWRVQAKHGWS